MKQVLITFSASRSVIKQSRLCDVETGGVLAGTTKPLTIVAAGSPGVNSIHQATRFTSDPEADKACLTEAIRQYGESIVPVGWWHKHPSGFKEPSSGDCNQAQQLAKEYGDRQPVLMGIVNQQPKLIRHKTTLYLYSIDTSGNLVEHDWKLVSSKNEQLLNAVRKAPVVPETRPSNYWTEIDFQFYLNPIGRVRIKQELENLRKAGWEVEVNRSKHNQLLILNITKSKRKLRFVLPPEFPLNPPTVLTANGRPFLKLETLSQWNSQCGLLDAATEGARIMRCSRCSKQCIQ